MTKCGVVLTSMLAIVLRAWAGEVNCPATIKVEEHLLDSVEEGWTEGRAKELHRLAGVTIFDGNPANQASLIPKSRTISKTQTLATWTFAKERQYWITCSYSGTAVVLSRAISEKFVSCSVTYSRNVLVSGHPEVQQINCE